MISLKKKTVLAHFYLGQLCAVGKGYEKTKHSSVDEIDNQRKNSPNAVEAIYVVVGGVSLQEINGVSL